MSATMTQVLTTESQSNRDVLLEVRGLKKHFPITRGLMRRVVGHVKAVDDINFDIYQGETLGLVGESGCGKSTTARLLLRAYDPTAGSIRFRRSSGWVDVPTLSRNELKDLRQDMQMIFQDPYGSLNPRLNLLQIIGEPFVIHGLMQPNSDELRERVAHLLEVVGLPPQYMERYPHAFSGGQRQRVGIARALALNPSFIAADEAVSALDVSIQAQTVNLLQDLQAEFNLTYLFITHDLSVVKHISDRVGVMYVGKMVELAPTRKLFAAPKHPYTEALLSAVPKPDPRLARRRAPLQGEVADPSNPPSGCYFHPRCQYAVDRCKTETPLLREIEPGHQVSCHRADELELKGVIN